MRRNSLFLLLVAFVLIISSVLPAFAADATEIKGYSKKTKYQYVTFGSFPADANATVEPLLWRVLEVKGNEAFLLTEYIVDVHYVHLDTEEYYHLDWEDSDLFAYLQNDFMPRAFTEAEQAALLQRTEDGGLVTLPLINDMRNANYGFADNNSRLCKGTEYAQEIGLYKYTSKHSPWLSREKSQDYPMQQRRVMSEGKLGRVPCGNVDLGIRPCVYVDLSMLSIASGNGTKDSPYVLQAGPAPTEAPTVVPTEVSTVAPTAVPTEIPAAATEAPAQAPVAQEQPTAVPAAATQAPITQQQGTVGSITIPIIVTNQATPVVSVATQAPAVQPTQAPAVTEAPAAAQATEIPAPQPEAEQQPAQAPAGGAFTAAANPETIHELFPELTAEGFLPDGQEEFVYKDEKTGLWLYASQTLRIEINRRTGTNSKKEPLRWYEAEVFTRDPSELFHLFPYDEAKYKNRFALELADKIARKHQLVFAINSDYFIYRVGRQAEVNYTYPIGPIIRNGEIFYDVPKKANSTVYPPLDVMALYPDGSVQVFLNAEKTAEEILASGATDTLAFGPILVENGEVAPRSKEFGNTPNPRTGFGMVEPGYYICLMVESRISESKGESCVWMGEKMAELGCSVAINLDGGATSTMIFMGEQINKSGNYGDITNRKQNELLGIGHSDAVK